MVVLWRNTVGQRWVQSGCVTHIMKVMEPKYKVGDIITVKNKRDGDSYDYMFGFTDIMLDAYGGQSFRINKVTKIHHCSPRKIPDDGYCYYLDGPGFSWASSMFEESPIGLDVFPVRDIKESLNDTISPFIRRRKRLELDFSI